MASLRRPWLFLVWLLPLLMVCGIVYQAPPWLEPQTLTVTLKPGQTVVLGREALWAPQADNDHVTLWRAPDGGWWLTNIASGKQVLWQPVGGHGERSLREWPLTTGAVFAVGTQQVAVLAADPPELVLQTAAGQRWEYDGIGLRRNGQPLPECYESWWSGLRSRVATLGLGRLLQRPLRLGGGVYCADRLGLAEAPVDTALITLIPSGFVLRPGNAGRLDGLPVTIAVGTPEAALLWRRSIPLAIHGQLMIGRTQYAVTQINPALELTVQGRAQRRLAGTATDTMDTVQVQWRPIAWLMMPDGSRGLLLLFLISGGAPLLWKRRSWWRDSRLWATASLALAGASLAVYFNTQTMPALWSYLLAWLALGVWLWTVRSPWSTVLLAVLALLLGTGLATLLQLGIGVSESGWMRYGSGSAALAGAFGWLGWAGRCLWRRWWPTDKRVNARLARWGLWLLGGVALALLALQAGFGNEGSWCGLQPFELSKLAVSMAVAYILMLKMQRWRRGRNLVQLSLWLPALGSAVLLLTASGFALVFLHDFSPLALLFIWALVLVWAYLRVHPRPVWRWSGGLIIVALILMIAAGMVRLHDRPEDFPLGFQLDRIRVWAAPDQHPHSGYQLRRALEAIRAGGWWGTAWKEVMNGRAMAIPVVESDFTPAFFLNRYGGVAALMLVGVQTVFILLLIGIANRALISTRGSDDRLAALGGFAYFALYGSAALLGAHFLVSWGTNLGFLPVMGQPMPLLSAAGSHLVFFVLPIVALAVAVEEGSHDNSF